jgi:4-hydroxy-tetrahydrodipicolinate reductase
MTKIDIGVFGAAGRMGQNVVKQIKKFGELKLQFLYEKKNNKFVGKKIYGHNVGSDLVELIKQSDVIIDFSVPQATLTLMKEIKEIDRNTALVTGTTGFSKAQEKKFLEYSRNLRVLRSFNMSIGVNMLKKLVTLASKNLSENADIEISEIHHNSKIDTPSGTSITLAESVKEGAPNVKKNFFRNQSNNSKRKKNQIGLSSIRGGDIVGEHTVFFFMDGERIELSHKATNREIFSNGALEASKWIFKKKPGLYTILDMIG